MATPISPGSSGSDDVDFFAEFPEFGEQVESGDSTAPSVINAPLSRGSRRSRVSRRKAADTQRLANRAHRASSRPIKGISTPHVGGHARRRRTSRDSTLSGSRRASRIFDEAVSAQGTGRSSSRSSIRTGRRSSTESRRRSSTEGSSRRAAARRRRYSEAGSGGVRPRPLEDAALADMLKSIGFHDEEADTEEGAETPTTPGRVETTTESEESRAEHVSPELSGKALLRAKVGEVVRMQRAQEGFSAALEAAVGEAVKGTGSERTVVLRQAVGMVMQGLNAGQVGNQNQDFRAVVDAIVDIARSFGEQTEKIETGLRDSSLVTFVPADGSGGSRDRLISDALHAGHRDGIVVQEIAMEGEDGGVVPGYQVTIWEAQYDNSGELTGWGGSVEEWSVKKMADHVLIKRGLRGDDATVISPFDWGIKKASDIDINFASRVRSGLEQNWNDLMNTETRIGGSRTHTRRRVDQEMYDDVVMFQKAAATERDRVPVFDSPKANLPTKKKRIAGHQEKVRCLEVHKLEGKNFRRMSEARGLLEEGKPVLLEESNALRHGGKNRGALIWNGPDGELVGHLVVVEAPYFVVKDGPDGEVRSLSATGLYEQLRSAYEGQARPREL